MTDKKISIRILHSFFGLLFFWWILIVFRGITDGVETYLFNLSYAVLGLFGGVLGVLRSREWGWWSSLYGKALFFIGLAILFWSLGGLIWAFYNFTGISDVPFPSIADHAGFLWYSPFSLFALIFLVQGLGFSFAWQKSGKTKFLLIAIPVVCTLFTFYIFENVREDSTFMLAFYKYVYNIFGGLLFALSIIIMFLAKYFSGGKLRMAVSFLVVGIAVQYIGDLAFTYRANPSIDLYYNADYTDMLYAASLYLISLGCAHFTLKN